MISEKKYKNRPLADALDYIDAKFIDEALGAISIPERSGIYKPNKKKAFAATLKFAVRAACAMLIVGLLISAPTIFTNIQNMIAPGTNVIDTEPSESVSDEELLKDIKICYTSEPVSLSEEEINGIVLAYLKLDTKPLEDYVVKCYGKHNDSYAVAVFASKYDIPELRSSHMGYDIYYDGKIYNRVEASEKGLLDKELFYQYADACIEYSQFDVVVKWKETFKDNPAIIPTYNSMIDVPYEVVREIVYLEMFERTGTHGCNASPYYVQCYFEKNGIYTYVCSSSLDSVNNALTKYTIAGCDFIDVDHGDESIMVLCDGSIYLLKSAYELGVIDDQYVKELYESYIEGHWWKSTNTPNKDLYEGQIYLS